MIALLALAAGLCLGLAFGRARQAGLRAERDTARAEAERGRADLIAAETRSRTAEVELARVSAALDHQRAGEQRLREAFASLSAEALARNNEAFVALAEARLAEAGAQVGGEMSQRQQAIEGLVAPLR
ncbi:MAG TPA: hypothetical protein VFX70_11655, partial [Mycobacteriales bacterium]|nr:hypothetical protein [Mycobacteriales bacterium]